MTSGQILDFNNARKQGEAARGSIDVDDIKDRLHSNPRAFIEWLYSGRAYFTKTEARIGNAIGEPGSSLRVKLGTGTWEDYATGEHGDLIALYRAWRGYTGNTDFVLSLKEIAKDFFNDPIEIERPSWQPTPVAQIEKRKSDLGTKPRQDDVDLGAPVATFKYYDLHGNITASVVRYEPGGTRESKTFRPWCFKEIDGQKKWMKGAPDVRPLYRLPEIATNQIIVLCEGEGKAEALLSVGIMATSAMQGAKAPIDKTDWMPLAGKTIIVWPDKDKPGFEYAVSVSAKLTSLNCTVYMLTPPDDVAESWDAGDCVAENGNPHALIEAAMAAKELPKPRFTFEKVAELRRLPPQQWLVKGWIPEQSTGIFYGKWAAGKSFIGFDLGLHLAYGMPDWHGAELPGRSTHVLVIAREGHQGFVNRIDAFKSHYGLVDDTDHLTFMRASVSFMKEDEFNALLMAIKTDATPYRLILVDTVARVLPGVDMNEQHTVTLFMERIGQLAAISKAASIGVHHQNKSGGMMGSTFFEANADFVFEISRNGEDGPLKDGEILCTKMKDAEDGWKRSVSYSKIALSSDDDGPTSLIVKKIEGPTSETNYSGSGWPNTELCKQILAAIDEQWMTGKPWCFAHNSSRSAVANISKRWKIKRQLVADMLSTWTANNIIEEAERDTKNHLKGYRVLNQIG